MSDNLTQEMDAGVKMEDIPDFLLEKIRGRLSPVHGSELDDEQLQERLDTMTPEQCFEACVGWELGDNTWARIFGEWMRLLKVNIDNL